MGLQERRRAASLIESEFAARRQALGKSFTDEDVARKATEIASAKKLSPLIVKLDHLREQVAKLEKDLAEAAAKIPGAKSQKKYRNGCECHGDFFEMLTEAAKVALEKESNREDALAKLRAEERRYLAQVESSETMEDIRSVLKKVGLI